MDEVENGEQEGGCWSELNTGNWSLNFLWGFSDCPMLSLPLCLPICLLTNIHFVSWDHYDAQGGPSYESIAMGATVWGSSVGVGWV